MDIFATVRNIRRLIRAGLAQLLALVSIDDTIHLKTGICAQIKHKWPRLQAVKSQIFLKQLGLTERFVLAAGGGGGLMSLSDEQI